jgi:hypothetical protein
MEHIVRPQEQIIVLKGDTQRNKINVVITKYFILMFFSSVNI